MIAKDKIVSWDSRISQHIDNRVVAEIDAADFGNVEIRTNGRTLQRWVQRRNLGFGWVSPEEFSRRVDDGPIVKGPFLYAYGLGETLHNGKIKANRPKIVVRDGDIVEVRNLVKRGHRRTLYFFASVDDGGYVKFDLAKAVESKGGSEREITFVSSYLSEEEYRDYLQAKS